jgi:hypothetical protein
LRKSNEKLGNCAIIRKGGDESAMEEQVINQEQDNKSKMTFNDVLVMLLSALYVWDWLEYPGLTVSRVVAVAVLAIWWTLFVLKLVKR